MACTCGKEEWVTEECLRDPLYEEVVESDENNKYQKVNRQVGSLVLYSEVCRQCGGENRNWSAREYHS